MEYSEDEQFEGYLSIIVEYRVFTECHQSGVVLLLSFWVQHGQA